MRKNRDEKNLTVLGKETVFEGVLKFTDELHVEGNFTGAIDAQGDLQISKEATCKVQYIKAASIVVEGYVVGNMTAVGKIDLKNGSRVFGNLTAGKLRIGDEVEFEGSVKMLNDNAQVEKDIFSINAEQMKDQIRRR